MLSSASYEIYDRLARRSLMTVLVSAVGFIALITASYAGPEQVSLLGWSGIGVVATGVVFLVLRLAFRWMGRQALFSPLIAFPLGYAAWYGLGLLTLLGDVHSKMLWCCGLGLVFYLLGAALGGGAGSLSSPRSKILDEWDNSYFWTVIAVLTALSLMSYLYLVSQIGIPALDPDAAERRLEVVKYGPLGAVFFTSTWTVLVFVAAKLWSYKGSSAIRILSRAILLLVSLMLLSLGSRGYLFVPMLAAMVARHFLYKRFRPLTLVLLGIVVFISLSVYGYLRDSTVPKELVSVHKGDVSELAIFPLIYAYLYIWQPIDTMQQVTEMIPRTIPYQHGFLTFGALRTLLPGHHDMSDMFFKQILGSDFVGGGQPATVLGPLYADFGFAGVVLGMFFIGLLVARTYRWMLREPTVFRVLIYAWVMQTLLFSLFGAIFPYITTIWIPFFWWILHATLLRKPTPKPALQAA